MSTANAVVFCPIVRLVLFGETSTDFTAAGTTCTGTRALDFPLYQSATVASPTATPVTRPVPSGSFATDTVVALLVTTESSGIDITAPLAFFGRPVTISDQPGESVRAVGVVSTNETAVETTVNENVALWPSQSTEMTAGPEATPVTVTEGPAGETVAARGLLLLQAHVRPVMTWSRVPKSTALSGSVSESSMGVLPPCISTRADFGSLAVAVTTLLSAAPGVENVNVCWPTTVPKVHENWARPSLPVIADVAGFVSPPFDAFAKTVRPASPTPFGLDTTTTIAVDTGAPASNSPASDGVMTVRTGGGGGASPPPPQAARTTSALTRKTRTAVTRALDETSKSLLTTRPSRQTRIQGDADEAGVSRTMQ